MRPVPVVRITLALALAPLVVSGIYLTVRHPHYVPIGDPAMAELLTRDVGRYAVLLGPYSRDGWYHPGPAMYYLLAVPYRLLGSTASALNVGALLVNAAAVGGMAWIARRRGGTPLMLLTLVGCALLMRSLGPDELRMPWNPYITVLPYALLLLLVWAMTLGERWALPAGVAVASFVAQTHIGYVGLALPVLAVGVGWLVLETLIVGHRDADRAGVRQLAAPVGVAVAVGFVMWLPPLVQQVTGDPGNLSAALDWFRSGGGVEESPRGYVAGWRLVSAQYGLPPEWLFGRRPMSMLLEPGYLYEPLVPVLLVPVLGAVYLLWRWRQPGAVRLAAVVLVASVVGVVSVARTLGPVYEYRIGWSSVLGMLSGVLVAWAAWTAAVRWRPALEGWVLVPVAAATVAVLAVVSSVAHVRAGRPQEEPSARLTAVVPDVVDGLPEGDGPIVVEPFGSFQSMTYAPALLLELERRGIEVRGRAGNDTVGDHRMDDGGRRRGHLVVATGDDIAAVGARPDVTLLAEDGAAVDDESPGGVAAAQPGQASDTALAVFLVDEPDEA